MKLIKDNIVAICLFLLTTAGAFTWNLIQKGSEATINETIDARIEAKLSDNHLIEMLLNTDKIKEFTEQAGKDIKNQIIEDVVRNDTNKISTRAFISKELNIREENYLPLQTQVLRSYLNGDLILKSQVDSLIKIRLRINRF